MKNIIKSGIILYLALFGQTGLIAQTSFTYNGIARDCNCELLNSQGANIVINVKLLPGTPYATAIYEEVHNVPTDANGVFSIVVGSPGPGGSVISGSFPTDWSTNTYYIKIKTAGSEEVTQLLKYDNPNISVDTDVQCTAANAGVVRYYNNALMQFCNGSTWANLCYEGMTGLPCETFPPCQGITQIEYEGQIYHTVEIGCQCWLKENLNVGLYTSSTIDWWGIHSDLSDNGIIEKYCYENNELNCEESGGLYDWHELLNYCTMNNISTKGICPNGWHIPLQDEFTKLIVSANYDGNALKEEGVGGGTNTSGFSAKITGNRYIHGDFFNEGQIKFWSSTWYISGVIYLNYFRIYNLSSAIEIGHGQYEAENVKGYSLRCIKDPCASITGGGEYCLLDIPGYEVDVNLSVTGEYNNVINWQKREPETYNWITINSTSDHLSQIFSAPAAYEYRAHVDDSDCPYLNNYNPGYTPSVVVRVYSQTVGGSINGGGETINLTNSTGVLTLDNYTGTIIRWEKKHELEEWVQINNLSQTYEETPALSGTWYYRAIVKNGGCDEVPSVPAVIVVQ